MSFGLVQGNRYVFRESMELRRVAWDGMIGWGFPHTTLDMHTRIKLMWILCYNSK